MDNQFLDSDIQQPTTQYKSYASFGARFGASVLDGIITSVIGLLVFGAFGINFMDLFDAMVAGAKNGANDAPDPVELFGSNYYMASLVTLAIRWYYFAQQESSEYKATLGKRAMGLVVTDLQGQRLSFQQASVRFFMKALSSVISLISVAIGSPDWVGGLSLVVLLGFGIQPFTEKKQALHDIVAKTLVYENKVS